MAAFQCLKRAYKLDGNQLLTQVDIDGSRGNGIKLKEGKFRSDIRGNFSLRKQRGPDKLWVPQPCRG